MRFEIKKTYYLKNNNKSPNFSALNPEAFTNEKKTSLNFCV